MRWKMGLIVALILAVGVSSAPIPNEWLPRTVVRQEACEACNGRGIPRCLQDGPELWLGFVPCLACGGTGKQKVEVLPMPHKRRSDVAVKEQDCWECKGRGTTRLLQDAAALALGFVPCLACGGTGKQKVDVLPMPHKERSKPAMP